MVYIGAYIKYIIFIIFIYLAVHKNININEDKWQVPKDKVHCALKNGPTIVKTQRHFTQLKKSNWRNHCGFPNVM